MKQTKMTIKIDDELHTAFRVICIQNNLTMREVIIKFIEEFNKLHGQQ